MLADVQKFLLPYWLQLQQQTQANPRLRWMLWGILYIFLIYFALSLGDWRAEQQQGIDQLQRTASKLEQLESQTEWPARWETEKQVGAQLRERLWKAKSIGLAEADLQNYLRGLINSHSGDGLRLRLAPTETLMIGDDKLFKISAELSAVVSIMKIDTLMQSMAENPQALQIDRFSYSAQRSGQLSILVTAYFLAIEEEAQP